MTKEADRQTLITRREAIVRVAAMLGGTALVGQAAMLAGCEDQADVTPPAANDPSLFSANEVELLDEIADTILPETDTPGAKAAEVGAFIALMVADSYYENDQQVFRQGLDDLQARCRDLYGTEFMAATPDERLSLLESLDAEQVEVTQSSQAGAPAHYFRMLKELTLLGYFTSEIGCTQAQRYIESPGRFDPCVNYTPGEKTWADHA